MRRKGTFAAPKGVLESKRAKETKILALELQIRINQCTY